MLNLEHKNFDLYKLGLQMIKAFYLLSARFTQKEQYGLITQIRRAAVSVLSNYSEGSSRSSAKEKVRFWEMARSSVVELDCQLDIVAHLGFVSQEEIQEHRQYLVRIFSMLSKLRIKYRGPK